MLKNYKVTYSILTIFLFYGILLYAKWRVNPMPRLCILSEDAFRWIYPFGYSLPKEASGLRKAYTPKIARGLAAIKKEIQKRRKNQ